LRWMHQDERRAVRTDRELDAADAAQAAELAAVLNEAGSAPTAS